MSLRQWLWLGALAGALAGCGSDETMVVLEVELTRYQIPLQMNHIVAEFTDGEGYLVERDLPLSAGQALVRIAVKQGPATPTKLTVSVHALLDDTVVAESLPQSFVFREGESVALRVSF